MECPNCKKQLADNAKSCPQCGYDFTEQKQKELDKKSIQTGCGCLLAVVIALAIFLNGCIGDMVDEVEADKAKNKFTAQDIQEADDYIKTMKATTLLKEVKNKCADGSTGCYYFVIDENLWNNQTNYEVKQSLQIASEIYSSAKEDYKFYEGKGYMSGKKLYDIWGVKNK